MYFFMRHQDGWIIRSLLRFCFHVTSHVARYFSSFRFDGLRHNMLQIIQKEQLKCDKPLCSGWSFFYTGTVASCHTPSSPGLKALAPAAFHSSAQPPCGQRNDHRHHQILRRFPFNCWYENISGRGGEGTDRGDHLNISSSASLAFSASLLLPLNPPLKAGAGGALP